MPQYVEGTSWNSYSHPTALSYQSRRGGCKKSFPPQLQAEVAETIICWRVISRAGWIRFMSSAGGSHCLEVCRRSVAS